METLSKIQQGRRIKASFRVVESLQHQNQVYESQGIQISAEMAKTYQNLIDLGYRVEVSLSEIEERFELIF